jgi:N-acetylmuramic acid 6-phosphate etherase
MMVNMLPTNVKLRRRAEAMVSRIADCDHTQAARSLDEAEGDIKMAVLLTIGADKAEAETILKQCDGNLRRVFAQLAKEKNYLATTASVRNRDWAVEP